MLPSSYELGEVGSRNNHDSYANQNPQADLQRVSAASAAPHTMEYLDKDVDMEDAPKVQFVSDFVSETRNRRQFEEIGDDMDVDRFMLKTETIPVQGNISYLTIDTNFILSHIDVVEQIRRLSRDYRLIIIIPLEVIRELDGLKSMRSSDSRDGKSISRLARAAISWVFEALAAKDSSVKGQANKQKIHKYARKDDAILDCSLYFREQFPHSLHILMSNDKNLCLKALINDLLTISFQENMSAQVIAETVYQENLHRFGKIDAPTVGVRQVEVPVSNIPNQEKNVAEVCYTIYKEVSILVQSIVGRCMKVEYGDDLHLVRDYDPNRSASLDELVQQIIRFWIPVFSHRLKTRPFEEEDKHKVPVHDYVPQDVRELKEFVEFWSECLAELYDGVMGKTEVQSLRVLIERWSKLSQFHV